MQYLGFVNGQYELFLSGATVLHSDSLSLHQTSMSKWRLQQHQNKACYKHKLLTSLLYTCTVRTRCTAGWAVTLTLSH